MFSVVKSSFIAFGCPSGDLCLSLVCDFDCSFLELSASAGAYLFPLNLSLLVSNLLIWASYGDLLRLLRFALPLEFTFTSDNSYCFELKLEKGACDEEGPTGLAFINWFVLGLAFLIAFRYLLVPWVTWVRADGCFESTRGVTGLSCAISLTRLTSWMDSISLLDEKCASFLTDFGGFREMSKHKELFPMIADASMSILGCFIKD